MALHRDIHWIGRQWAVTGHGMQLIDQKLQGFFDIEAARVWDENLIASMQAKEWINAADFDKGLAVARARYPQPPGTVTPRPEATAVSVKPIAPLPPAAKLEAPKPDEPSKPDRLDPAPPSLAAPALRPSVVATPDPIGSPQATTPDFHMRFDGQAKFTRPWRVWMKQQT
jgi:hypothetical protein